MLEKIILTPYLDELGYLHNFWPSGLILAFIQISIIKICKFASSVLIAQLVVGLTFAPEDPGSNPIKGDIIFIFSLLYIFEKIRVSRSFFGASKATESNRKFVALILAILAGH